MLRMWEELTEVEKLQSIWSDFYKDVNGFRPRFATNGQWNDAVWLQGQIDDLHKSIERRKDTFAGREELREEGWQVEETDPKLALFAKWLADERARQMKELYGDEE